METKRKVSAAIKRRLIGQVLTRSDNATRNYKLVFFFFFFFLVNHFGATARFSGITFHSATLPLLAKAGIAVQLTCAHIVETMMTVATSGDHRLTFFFKQL